MNKWTWLVVGAFVIWGIISWNWYVCGIKGFCQEEAIVQQDDSISIGEIDDEVAERPVENIQGTVAGNSTARQTTTVTREKIVECSTYLDSYLRRGYQNSPSDMRRLEQFLNEYESENLTVNGVFELSDERAVERFQEKYRSEVLTPWGLQSPTGYVYRTTRDHINSLYCAYTSVENN